MHVGRKKRKTTKDTRSSRHQASGQSRWCQICSAFKQESSRKAREPPIASPSFSPKIWALTSHRPGGGHGVNLNFCGQQGQGWEKGSLCGNLLVGYNSQSAFHRIQSNRPCLPVVTSFGFFSNFLPSYFHGAHAFLSQNLYLLLFSHPVMSDSL